MRLKLIVFIFLAVNLFALTQQENNLSSTKENNVYQRNGYYGWGCNRGCYGYRERGCYGYRGGYGCRFRGSYGYRKGYGYRGGYGCRGYYNRGYRGY